ncbi:MAG: oligopeptide ABC transporter permease OppB [Panacagrimonas sp.]
MLRQIPKRLLQGVIALFVLVTLAFFMMRAAPGGPFDSERALPPEIIAQLEQTYHLDEPLWQQYLRYLGGVLQGDLGPSYQYTDFTVNELIWAGLPVSLTIGASAIALALVVGAGLGMMAAVRQNALLDHLLMTVAMIGISLPNFVIAPLMILLFALILSVLPAGGWSFSDPRTMVLPILALAAPQVAYIARITRGSMIEVLSANFIRTARAKGLSGTQVILRHALRPAMIPVVSYLGPAAAGVITGSVVIEQIFGIPGIGRHFVQAALNRDYTLVMGVVVFYGSLIIVFNFLVDLIYGLLDPRARTDHD